jgi:hypothetical protein
MTPGDLFFLASVLLVLTLTVRIAVSMLRRRWETARRLATVLGFYLGCYAALLIGVALARPRRILAPGERRCFDDWCAAAITARPADGGVEQPCESGRAGRVWIATLEVSSVAKRIRQRARDARAEIEDRVGKRYEPCAPALKNGGDSPLSLSAEIGPGESFRLLLPFRLPAGSEPAGIVFHHGDFPGAIIIGADQSFRHPPALHRLSSP